MPSIFHIEKFDDESNADLYWNSLQRLELLRKRLSEMKAHDLAHQVKQAIAYLNSVADIMEKGAFGPFKRRKS